MSPATRPRPSREVRVLVVDRARGDVVGETDEIGLPRFFARGDLVVVNDAATLPASVRTRDARGGPVELRLAGPPSSDLVVDAVLFGAGDHRTPTERRRAPPRLEVGDMLTAGELEIVVLDVARSSERLVTVHLAHVRPGAERAEVLAALFRAARPVQYAHVPAPLALWDVQNVWAGEPWAVEMPSAGRVFSARTVAALRARGVDVAWVTHAAGLSHVGDDRIDRALPFPERTRVPSETVRAILGARARGGRVVAAGTSVVRALETAARGTNGLAPVDGITDLRIERGTELRVVSGLVTGVHEPGTSHHALLSAFLDDRALTQAAEVSEARGFLGHEHGDAWLVLPPRSGERA